MPQTAVYATNERGEPVEADYKYAIVILNVKDTDTIRASYGREWIDDPVSFQVYQECGMQCLNLAGYILRLGCPAFPSIVGTYKNLMTPLIIESGLGGAAGIALNPFVGSSFKAAAVLTDLPLVPDKPIDFGLLKYCAECKLCAEQCLMHAISDREKEVYNGYETYRMNFKLVIRIMTNPVGNFCQRCTKTCPWNRPDNRPEDFRNWDGNLQHLYDSVERQAKYMRDNNFVEPTEYKNKWWLPLEVKKGKLLDAPEFNYDHHFSRMKQNARSGRAARLSSRIGIDTRPELVPAKPTAFGRATLSRLSRSGVPSVGIRSPSMGKPIPGRRKSVSTTLRVWRMRLRSARSLQIPAKSGDTILNLMRIQLMEASPAFYWQGDAQPLTPTARRFRRPRK